MESHHVQDPISMESKYWRTTDGDSRAPQVTTSSLTVSGAKTLVSTPNQSGRCLLHHQSLILQIPNKAMYAVCMGIMCPTSCDRTNANNDTHLDVESSGAPSCNHCAQEHPSQVRLRTCQ